MRGSNDADRLRLHIESRRAQAPAFHIDAAAWALAAGRHPEAAARIDVSFGWDGEVLSDALADADALLASRFDRAAVNAAPRLRWIHTTGAGVDQLLPLDTLRSDLTLTNSSGIHVDKAGEYVRMALLMLNARMPDILAAQAARRWIGALTTPIAGKTALVIGYGDIGQAAGHAAVSLGMRVIAVTRSGVAPAGAPVAEVVSTARLDDVLPQADHVIVTVPLTPHTRGLLDAERIAALRPGAGIVNMARAAIVDYAALARRLARGELAGALLDVFDPEPLPEDAPWWTVPRMIVTPHVSCDAPDYHQRVLDLWFDNYARMRAGTPMRNCVDRVRGY